MYILKQIECSSAFSRRTNIMKDESNNNSKRTIQLTNDLIYEKTKKTITTNVKFVFFRSFVSTRAECFVFSTHSFSLPNRIASCVFLLELWNRALFFDVYEHFIRCVRLFFLNAMLNILFHFCLFFFFLFFNFLAWSYTYNVLCSLFSE